MSNVQLTWKLKTPGSGQLPVAFVRVQARSDGVDEWTTINEVAPPKMDLLDENVTPGTHEYRGIVVDEEGAASKNPLTATVKVPSDPPSDLETFTAELS